MTREPAPQHRELPFSEDAAHRLLARAVELDVQRVSQVSVAQLREIAREAGIAAEAFEDALAEFHSVTEAAAEPANPGPVRALRRWWRNIDASPSELSRPSPMWKDVTINALAFAIFWMVLSAFSRTSALLGLDWPANHAGNIIANLLGVGVALRLRARVTAVLLGVTAAAQLAAYVMHLLFGIGTVQGGPTHWALMLAGLLGIALGAVLARPRQPRAHLISDVGDERADATNARSGAVPDEPPSASLRLRTA
jgi:hypothetical protein